MKIIETNIKVPTRWGHVNDVTQYKLIPEPGHILRNKRTGSVVKSFIVLSSKSEINNYEEI